jgi:hypothetical protein
MSGVKVFAKKKHLDDVVCGVPFQVTVVVIAGENEANVELCCEIEGESCFFSPQNEKTICKERFIISQSDGYVEKRFRPLINCDPADTYQTLLNITATDLETAEFDNTIVRLRIQCF